jgi:hypothetical protein
MKGKLIWSIFWVLVGVFVIVVAMMVGVGFFPAIEKIFMRGWFFIVAGFLFLSLGITLLVLTLRGRAGGLQKKFLILTGAAAAGIPVFAVLHNLVYALFILGFGEGFWDRTGMGDEPFFFILAVIVCPLGFLVGVVGSIVLFIKKGRAELGST